MVGLELLRLAAPRGLDDGVGVGAGLLPRIGDGDDFEVGRGEVGDDVSLLSTGTYLSRVNCSATATVAHSLHRNSPLTVEARVEGGWPYLTSVIFGLLAHD